MKVFILKLIRLYQKTEFFHQPIFKALFLSDRVCRFKPTCSQYCYQAIEKYGIIKGSFLGLQRIFKCHPWSKGGEDLLN
jgi:putative membrane protein insertion efficiency factor